MIPKTTRNVQNSIDDVMGLSMEGLSIVSNPSLIFFIISNKENDMKTLNSFNLERHNTIKHLRVLLYGPIGSGKSSFINSVDSVCQNRITTEAMANMGGDGTFTVQVRSFWKFLLLLNT